MNAKTATTLDMEIAEAHRLNEQQAKAQEKHDADLAKIDFDKQFLVRDKIAQILTLMRELGFSSLEDERGDTILDIRETNISALTGKK